MKNLHSGLKQQRPHNRIAAVMVHSHRYCFKGLSRLSADCGVSVSAISRLLAGKTSPTYTLVAKIAESLEVELGKPISVRELVSPTGEYPTPWVCQLCGCPGCTPPAKESRDPEIRLAFQDVKPGFWTGDNREAWAPKWQPVPEVK